MSPKSSSPASKQTNWPMTMNPSSLCVPLSPYFVQQEIQKQELLKVFNNCTIPFSNLQTESKISLVKRFKTEGIDQFLAPNWYNRFAEYKHYQSDSVNLTNLYNSMYANKQSFLNLDQQKNCDNFVRGCFNKPLNIGGNIVIK